jgi:heterodisulfide reductase subunit A
VAPTRTAGEGVFVAGCAAGPKDIVDSIMEAGAASSEASRFIVETRGAAKQAG